MVGACLFDGTINVLDASTERIRKMLSVLTVQLLIMGALVSTRINHSHFMSSL